ncbi:lipoamide acyltransferase component of branched-chain alpha-keto acid dehydrogenase complex, mitochondrial [Linepithema humile]|uniref:lipoamide acyltransferase component of branched-chain alpha-keto acid dehydrogenase complex, mitochondrial n=1 Tax=Linepithema humile TaxID=83485 RepID=UPI0006232FDF|nr:PREDICTED: lipoamide acyltransferase component of branched-chain alpha-keto acid dehydrogenase complex, mitochondrial [Linepithema humile]
MNTHDDNSRVSIVRVQSRSRVLHELLFFSADRIKLQSMALSGRLLMIARLAGRSRDPICRFLSTSSTCSGKVVPFQLSDIGEGIRDVTVKEWFVKPGDRVSQFDDICEVQSDKASVTITSRYDGLIKALHFKVDDVAMVGTALLDIEIDDDSKDTEDARDTESSAESQMVDSFDKEKQTDEAESRNNVLEKTLVTPAVRRIAMENNIKLKDVIATGKQGRVLKEDILAHLQKVSTTSEAKTTRTLPQKTITGRTIEPKGYSRYMWKAMTRSLSIPHFVYSDECNVDRLMHCRNEVKDSLKDRDVLLTMMPFFVKAASRALEQCPKLNAWLDEESQTLRILDNHNIGIAMDTPEGLVVPNIKNVQNLSVVAIAKELNRLQKLGKQTSIPLDDLTDTTFSLSNIGVIGGTYTKPMILPPQVIIGAFGKAQRVPRFDEKGNVIPANIMSVSWSADHRVLDGVTVARFSNLWKYYVENPAHLLIGA